MPRLKDRTNDRYGRLRAVSYMGKDHRGKVLWLCECSCGNKKVVVSDNLSSGKSKSCGCLKTEFLARSGNQYGLYTDRVDAILKVQYSHLKRRHKKISTDECISFATFKEISLGECRYCGSPYSRKLSDRTNETRSGKLMSDTVVMCNGIDRVDNALGYIDKNCVPCCKTCNSAKGVMSLQDFRVWALSLNRKFIGIEKDDKYFEIAKNRIENHAPNIQMELAND